MADDQPLSPLWWVRRLHKLIVARSVDILLYDDYYSGNFRAPWLAPQARAEFRRVLDLTGSNYMGLVVDATVERLQVEGFRVAADSTAPDREVWRAWQANGMDAESDEAFNASVRRGRAFFHVAPNIEDEKTPHIWVEDALQCAVEYEPGSNRRRRAAALKVWRDDWTGLILATLFLPDGIYKFRSADKTSGDVLDAGTVQWVRREVPGEAWPLPNRLAVVPIIELPNMSKAGASEIHDVICIQDRIGKTIADRLMSQDFGAFPQKWATGYPDEDAAGNPQSIDIGRNRMVTSDATETTFGQWEAAPLDPYSMAKSEDVNDIAARTRTPPQYLLGRMANLPGEALKAAESGLVAKVKRRQRVFSDPLEEVVRLVRRAAGIASEDAMIETVWRNPEFRSEGELVDALVKMRTLGVPYEALWERWGATPSERERWKKMVADELTVPLLDSSQPDAPPDDETAALPAA